MRAYVAGRMYDWTATGWKPAKETTRPADPDYERPAQARKRAAKRLAQTGKGPRRADR